MPGTFFSHTYGQVRRKNVPTRPTALSLEARVAARFEAFGRRYWARNLEMGLAGVPAAFRLPDALRSRPSSLRAG